MRAVASRLLILLLLCLSVTAYAATENKSFYFLAMADIHFDPFIPCYESKNRSCAVIKRLSAAPASQWDAILSEEGDVDPVFHQDTNYKLFKANLGAARQAAEEYPLSFVMVLGDTLGHNFRIFYRKYTGDKSQAGFENFARKTLEYINLEFKKAFPATSVFMVVGNNDTYSRNYQAVPGGAFFSDAASLWSQLIVNSQSRAAMRREFSSGGYYAVDVPGFPQLRLIALNSVLFSKYSVWKSAKTEANRELSWLGQELKLAKQRNQQVIIALHIPGSLEVYATRRWHWFTLTQFWRTEYLERFKAELASYYPQVVAIFSGHLHYDWNQSLTVGDRKAIPVIGVPAISPIFGSDPSFKIYHFSLDDSNVEDYYTYYYPVSGRGSWGMEHAYNFFFKEKG